MKKVITKFLLVIIITIMTFGGTFSFITTAPQKAEAQFIVHDPPAFIRALLEFAQTVAKWFEDHYKEILRDLVVKQLVDKLTDDIVRSIANDGDPSFVGDWKDYLRDAGDVAFNEVNSFLNDQGLDLCSPLAPQIQLSLRYQIIGSQLPVSCRFDEFKRAIQYTDHFIERGGWLAYDQMFVPSNNYYGLSVLARDRYYANLEEEKNARLNEALSSRGFLNTKECVKLNGGFTQEDINQECGDDNQCKSYIEKQWCAQWRVLTPGDVAAEAVSSSIKSDAWWVTNVQSVVSAIVNSFVSKVFDKARGGLVGSDGGGGSTINTDDDTQNVSNTFNNRRLDAIRDQYESFITYVTQTILPLINRDLSEIQILTCNSRRITFDDADENSVTMTISELGNFLTLAQQVSNQALSDAQQALAQIDLVDLNEPGGDLDAVTVISDYQSFTSTYPIFIADLNIEENGGQGSLSILYSNIYRALIQFDCGQSSF